MSITTQFLTGFEHGFIGAGANNGGGLFDAAPGSGWSASTSSPRNGAYCAHLVAPANTVTRLAKSITGAPTKIVGRFAFKIAAFADCQIVYSTDASTGTPFDISLSAGQFIASLGGSGKSGGSYIPGKWHLIEFQIDLTAKTLDWKIDGVLKPRVTATVVNAPIDISLGTKMTTGPTFTADYDDFIFGTWTDAAADWYGDGKVIRQLAGVDGTHAAITSFSPGDAGAAYSGTPTTVNTMVDDPPGTGGWTATRSATDNIAMRSANVGAYAEIRPAPVAATEWGVPNAVRAIMSYSSSATQANNAACEVRNAAGAITELWGLIGGAGKAYNIVANQFKSAMVTTPAAGWTVADINFILFRFGGSSSVDISPVPTVQAMMVEVDWPVPLTGTPINETSIDDFNRADGPVYSGAGASIWESAGAPIDNAIASGMAVSSNKLIGTLPAATSFARSKSSLQSDFDLLYDVVVGAQIQAYFALTDIGTSGYDGYRANISSGQWRLEYYTNGASSTILNNINGPLLVAGNTVWIAKRGTVITLYHRASVGAPYQQVLTVDDPRNNVASPFFLAFPNTTAQIDNVRGGPFDATGTTYNDTGSGNIAESGSAVEDYSHDASVSGTITASGSGIESYSTPVIYTDSASGTITSGGVGTDNRVYDDSASGSVTSSGTGTDARIITDTAVGTITSSGTGTDNRIYNDITVGTIVSSGTGIESRVSNDSGVGTISSSGSGVDSCVYTDSGLGTTTVIGSGTEAYILPPSAYEAVILADNPVGYWRLNDLTDSSGHGFTLTQGGTVISTPSLLVTDPANGSKEFKTDPHGDHLIHADDPLLRLSNAFSVEAWAVLDFMPEAWTLLGRFGHYRIEVTNAGKFRSTVFSTTGFWTVDSTTDVVVGQTYHLAMTFDGTVERLYINGVQEGSFIVPSGTLPTDTTGLFAIGNEPGYTNLGWWGRIDEVAVYSTVLLPIEVQEHYTVGSGVTFVTNNDSGSGTVTASGSGIESYVNTDSGSGTVTASGTSTESYVHVYIDSSLGTVTASGSGIESYVNIDSRSGTVTASGSGTESYSSVDSSSGTITTSGNRVEQVIYADSSSGTVTVSGIGTEAYTYADSGSGTVTASGSGTESYVYADNSSGTVTASGSGVESYQVTFTYVDSGSGTVTISGSGVEQAIHAASGSGTVTASGSGTESYQVASNYADSGSGTIAASGSGVESYQPTYADIASGTVVSSGSGTESYSNIDSGLGTITSNGTRAEFYSYADSGSGTANASGTGSDTRVYPDTSTGTITATGTGSDDRAYGDTNTGTIIATGTSVESYSHMSTATGSVAANGTSVESQSHTSTATGIVFVDGTGSETYNVDTSVIYTDTSVGIITSTGTGVDSVSYSDSATGTVISTGTSVDSVFHSNTAVGTVTLFGNGVESYSYTDASTGIIVVTGIGREFGVHTQPVPFSTVIALNRFKVEVWNKTSIRSVVTSTAPISVQIALQRTVKVDVVKQNKTKVLIRNR